MENMNSLSSDNIGSNSFLTPLTISLIGIASASIILLIYHYISIKFCINRSQQSTGNNHSPPLSATKSPTGVDMKILETIPIITYSTEDQSRLFRQDQTECVVCLAELEHGEMVRLLPTCKHAFHVPCIDQWFVAHVSCPICRSPMVAPVKIDTAAAPPSPSPPSIEQIISRSIRILPPRPNQERDRQSSGGGLLRHCGSLVLPTAAVERRRSKRRLITGLKRSLSLDQSSVIVEIERENLMISGGAGDCSSSSSSSSDPKDDLETRTLCRTRSGKQYDRVSAKLLRSFSRLRMGNCSEILPY